MGYNSYCLMIVQSMTWTISPLSWPVTIRSSNPFHIKDVTFGPLAGMGKLIIVLSENQLKYFWYISTTIKDPYKRV